MSVMVELVIIITAAFVGSYFGAWCYEQKADRSKIKLDKVFKTLKSEPGTLYPSDNLIVDSVKEYIETPTALKRKPRTADEMAKIKELKANG